MNSLPFLIREMAPAQLWSAYIRYIGAGAVLAAGLITLCRTLPTIVASAREGLKGFGAGADSATVLRTERDLPTDRASRADLQPFAGEPALRTSAEKSRP